MKKNTYTSYIMLISAMLIFGTIGIFRRSVPISSVMLASIRGLIGACFLFIFTKLKGRKIFADMGVKNLLLLFLTGAIIGVNWILLFESYNYTTIPIATLCFYMQPTIVILASPIFFKEHLSLQKIIAVIISVLGMIFVSGIFDGQNTAPDNGKGIAFGLGAAVLYATAVILNKKIEVEDAFGKTVIQIFAASVTLLPYLLLTEDFSSISLSPISVAILLMIGILHTGIAYTLYFSGMSGLPSQSVAIISYLDPVSALVFSAVFIGEKMSLWGIFGAVLIIGSAFLCELAPKKKSHN